MCLWTALRQSTIYITAEITCVTGAKKTAKEQSKIPW